MPPPRSTSTDRSRTCGVSRSTWRSASGRSTSTRSEHALRARSSPSRSSPAGRRARGRTRHLGGDEIGRTLSADESRALERALRCSTASSSPRPSRGRRRADVGARARLLDAADDVLSRPHAVRPSAPSTGVLRPGIVLPSSVRAVSGRRNGSRRVRGGQRRARRVPSLHRFRSGPHRPQRRRKPVTGAEVRQTAVAPRRWGSGPALCSRREEGGDPVTYIPTVICEVVAS
jgi:hypothetical protein